MMEHINEIENRIHHTLFELHDAVADIREPGRLTTIALRLDDAFDDLIDAIKGEEKETMRSVM